jgi:hypothetical protein
VTVTVTNVINVTNVTQKVVKNDPKCIKKDPKLHKSGQKHKKLFFSAPGRARTVLNAFLECMYYDKMYMDGRCLMHFWVIFDHFLTA